MREGLAHPPACGTPLHRPLLTAPFFHYLTPLPWPSRAFSSFGVETAHDFFI